MIENVLIIDTETTGLSPRSGDKLIEIAAVLFNVQHKAVLQNFSTLLPCESNPVEAINHIKVEHTKCAYPLSKLPDILMTMGESAQACMAHNADFDKKFLALLPEAQPLLNKKWICTQKDFRWPFSLTRFRLQDICIACQVLYLNAHRALSDCLLLAQCLSKVPDLEERINGKMKH